MASNEDKGSRNPIADAAEWYRQHGPAPWATSLLAGALMFGAGRMAWNPVMETVRSLGRPFARKRLAKGDLEWDRTMDIARDDSRLKTWLPLLAGLLGAGGTAYALYRPNRAHGGMLSWNAPERVMPPRGKYSWQDIPYMPGLKKTGAVDPYVQDIDWNHTINLGVAHDLFVNDTMQDHPDARLTGLAIVNNAAINQGTRSPSLGGIFDSALNKIEKKLTLGTAVRAGVRSVLANTAARMFTGALGAMCDLPQGARQTLVDAGTWAGAVSAILE